MHKIDVNVAGLDHDAIHHQVIWCGKSVRLCTMYVIVVKLWANIMLHWTNIKPLNNKHQ